MRTKEEIKEYQKRYHLLNKEAIKLKRKEWEEKNREKIREYSRFTDGMNWSNRGKWHVDHIIPISSFDLSSLEEQKKAFHYTNLQPLWAVDNLKKGNKII